MSLATVARVYEEASCQIMARVEDRPAAYLTPGSPFLTAQVASILLTVKDVAAGQPVPNFNGVPLTPASVWFDTLQPWAADNRGFNFLYTLGPRAFPAANSEYRVEVQIILTDGRVGFAIWDVTTETSQ